MSSTFQSRSDSSLNLVLLHGGFERPLGVPTQSSILNETQRYVNTFFTPRLNIARPKKGSVLQADTGTVESHLSIGSCKSRIRSHTGDRAQKRASQSRSSGLRINLLIIRILLCPFLPVHNQHRKSLATAPPCPIHYQN